MAREAHAKRARRQISVEDKQPSSFPSLPGPKAGGRVEPREALLRGRSLAPPHSLQGSKPFFNIALLEAFAQLNPLLVPKIPMSFLIGKPNQRFTTNKSFLLLGGAEQLKNEPKQMKSKWLFLTIAPCDAAEPWQLGFQDAATPMMQGIIDLHHDIFFFLILILVFVSRILVRALWHFHYPKNPIPQRIVHGTTIEILRTIFPSIIPMFIAIPSFALLYSMDEVVVDPAMTIKAIGHQWYRTYEYSDYNSSDEQSLTFDSYTIPEDDLELGQSRLLEVDNRVVVPAKTHLRIIVTPADVPHSWAVPSLGVKCDAVPGRLNQISISVQREGVYYGQCSEICGTNHAFTPIVVEAVPSKDYGSRVSNQLIPQTTGEA
uniref:Cytochrome c oxidase subunit 2 n=3 Tax=Ammopiptanthus TaxID=111850 RepID=A0A385G2A9_AMMMO|nr:cytochrome c oxidase subunit 2 [Ammopiptanthus mongolicus]AXV54333.1 cytochrome c oxidase subunit 2 [Ammopiptanthus mongolicus]